MLSRRAYLLHRGLARTLSSEPVLLSESGGSNGVLTLTLNRPRQRNALSSPLMEDLTRALTGASESPKVRAIVLRAAGPVFSSGHDLKELHAAATENDAVELRRIFDRCEALMHAVRNAPVPVIAAVGGAAHAAGCQLVAHCDLVVADAERASFATPGVKIGLFCHTPAVAVVRALGGGTSGARRAAMMLCASSTMPYELCMSHSLLLPQNRSGSFPLSRATPTHPAPPFPLTDVAACRFTPHTWARLFKLIPFVARVLVQDAPPTPPCSEYAAPVSQLLGLYGCQVYGPACRPRGGFAVRPRARGHSCGFDLAHLWLKTTPVRTLPHTAYRRFPALGSRKSGHTHATVPGTRQPQIRTHARHGSRHSAAADQDTRTPRGRWRRGACFGSGGCDCLGVPPPSKITH